MNAEALLQLHAEVAIALAGFASVIAALNRPLSPFARQRFLSLLALAVIQVLGCLLPLWLLRLVGSPETLWRLLSLVVLLLNLARMWWLVILPARTFGGAVGAVMNPVMTRLTFGAGFLGFFCFAIDALGFAVDPNFDLYYAGLLLTLLVGFALFADVATRDA